MVISLSPQDKFHKFGADIVPLEENPLLAMYRYRVLPNSINPENLLGLSVAMIKSFKKYCENFIDWAV